MNQLGVPEVPERIASAPFKFYLTGSRFFGHHDKNSDWDFFVESASGLRRWLRLNGFSLDESGSYVGCSDIREMWTNDVADIDIQVVRNAKVKNRIQNLIREDQRLKLFLSKSTKEERQALWDLVFMGVYLGRQIEDEVIQSVLRSSAT